MPHDFRALWLCPNQLRVVYLTTVGGPSFAKWRDTLIRVFPDPSFKPGFNFISNRRRATVPSRVFVEQEVDFVRQHEREFGHCRWAAVVPNPATDQAVRTVTSWAGIPEVEVGFFYDLAAARRWIFGNARGGRKWSRCKGYFKRKSSSRIFCQAATPNSEATNFACPYAFLPADLLTRPFLVIFIASMPSRVRAAA
jgi:hypothetical protein